jgi:hypothetical protein
MRAALAATAIALLGLSGCGGADPPAEDVRLALDAPGDMTLLTGDTVEVRGTVRPPGARVMVEGRQVDVRAGSFSEEVELLPGTNLIDVVAGSDRARPAMAAIRVQRQVSVQVPDLIGFTPRDARDTLAALGLEADVQEAGGLIEFLLPEDARVCETDPAAGGEVDPGSTVTVLASKRC